MSASSNVRVDLAALATMLSRADGDGHHWAEDDARQWLLRMGFAAPGGVDGGEGGSGRDGGCSEDPRLLRLVERRRDGFAQTAAARSGNDPLA